MTTAKLWGQPGAAVISFALKLFVDVTPDELAQKGKSFPIKPYFDDIQEAYEKKVN